jgi:WhiB family transcriptional regulator, redox-sensing transcriptional regulator
MITSNFVVPEEGWQIDAACRGSVSELFFAPTTFESPRARTIRETAAKKICAVCPVIESCSVHAISVNEPHGIWGGMNESERRILASRQSRVS